MAAAIWHLPGASIHTSWSFYPDWSVEDLRRYLGFCVEVINHAIEGLPEDRIRFHTCWGSGHRPHVNDIELKDIVDLMLKINAKQYSIEAANVRHERCHWWEIGPSCTSFLR